MVTDKSTEIGICGVTDGKFDSAVLQYSQGATHNEADAQFFRTTYDPCHLHPNLQSAQSGRLLQSHTLMERCRGDLLR